MAAFATIDSMTEGESIDQESTEAAEPLSEEEQKRQEKKWKAEVFRIKHHRTRPNTHASNKKERHKGEKKGGRTW